MEVDPLVYFISISTEPAEPAPDRFGTGASWVLHGAPSLQKARAWAHAQHDRMLKNQSAMAQRIREFVLVPFVKTLCSERGSELIDWTALPSLQDRRRNQPRRCGEPMRDFLDHEMHGSGMIHAPNQSEQEVIAGEITLETLRTVLEQQLPKEAIYNWDVEHMWYFILYTSEQATLVRAVNSFAAALPYTKAARGTSLGDDNAMIAVWQGLHFYSEGDPRMESQ